MNTCTKAFSSFSVKIPMNKFSPHFYPISRFINIAPRMGAWCDSHWAEEHHFY